MNCIECWNYENCGEKYRTDLAICFEKGYTCKYCGRVECEFYNTKTRCMCTKFMDKPQVPEMVASIENEL